MPRKRKTDQAEDVAATKRSRRARTTRGVLESMPDMPLDILFEIFRHFMPMDLLNLARTTKVFRRFLMARSAAPLWKTARLNDKGLPECPPHLSEPAYANLAFDTHCHSCHKSNVRIVLWAFSARYCPGCRKTNFLKCLFTLRACSRRHISDDIFRLHSGGLYARENWHWHRRGHSSAKVAETYQALDTEGQAAYMLRIRETLKWASECEKWDVVRGNERDAELEGQRKSRLNSIVTRLTDVGWGDELDRMKPLGYEPLTHCAQVNKAQLLTDRIWNNIRAGILEWMESYRAERLEKGRLNALTDRCKTFRIVYTAWYAKQKDKITLPRAIELMFRPEVRAIVEQDTDHPVSPTDFEVFTDDFARWATDWEESCDEKLRELVRDSPALKDELPGDVDPLSLASVVFTCKGCKGIPGMFLAHMDEATPMLYPTVLTHGCLYAKRRRGSLRGVSPFERATVLASPTESVLVQYGPWSCNTLEVDVFHARVAEIIAAFGKDPSRTTRDEMDAIDDVRLYCFDCPRDSSGFLHVMNWRHALQHSNSSSSKERHSVTTGNQVFFELPKEPTHKPDWRCITDPDLLSTVLQKEEEFMTALANHQFTGFGHHCSHCPTNLDKLPAIHQHLHIRHGIEVPAETDVYIPADAEMTLIRPTMLVQPHLRDAMPEDLRTAVDKSKRAAWYDFAAAAPRPEATSSAVAAGLPRMSSM